MGGYHHPMYHPPIMPDLGHRGGNGEDEDHRRSQQQQQRPSSQQRGINDEGDVDLNEPMYKRYRTL
jgi:hypothetical protein